MNPPSAAATTRWHRATPGDLYGRAIATGGGLRMRVAGGASRPLPLERWLGETTAADEDALDRAVAPVIDVGCGPGRHVAALAARGCLVLGVDVTPAAVAFARDRGAAVLEASVFDRLPTRWATALLLDGNIGIGGEPSVLLHRVAGLLDPEVGRVLVELDEPGTPSGTVRVRLEHDGVHSPWFDWAHVAADAIERPAARAGLRVTDRWRNGGRWFALLER